ncbi:MAG: hypothetical protein ACJ8KU_06085, partial [Chthoniobacterales bacterium]
MAARLYPARVVADVFAGEQADVDVVAENVGQTLWDGQVRLAYRWSRLDGNAGGANSPVTPAAAASAGGAIADLPALTGRVFLGKDTPPGWSYRFTDRITTPTAPGAYRLTISMLAEGITDKTWKLYPPRNWGFVSQVDGGIT